MAPERWVLLSGQVDASVPEQVQEKLEEQRTTMSTLHLRYAALRRSILHNLTWFRMRLVQVKHQAHAAVRFPGKDRRIPFHELTESHGRTQRLTTDTVKIRRQQVLEPILQGLSTRAIAKDLGVARGTIRVDGPGAGPRAKPRAWAVRDCRDAPNDAVGTVAPLEPLLLPLTQFAAEQQIGSRSASRLLHSQSLLCFGTLSG
jgi:hypothetical protein